MMNRLQKSVLLLIAGLLIAVIGVWMYSALYSPVPDEHRLMEIVQVDCRNTQQACVVRHSQLGELQLRFPQGAYYMQPFKAELETARDTELEAVTLDLAMSGMNMGQNRFQLKAVSDNLWRGSLLLPICVTGRVDWKLTLEVVRDGQRYQATFPLELQAPPARKN
ncbi:MAG: hypothetical protein PVH51_05050 [Thiohalophilus sp.]|jgi:hypothetical protein